MSQAILDLKRDNRTRFRFVEDKRIAVIGMVETDPILVEIHCYKMKRRRSQLVIEVEGCNYETREELYIQFIPDWGKTELNHIVDAYSGKENHNIVKRSMTGFTMSFFKCINEYIEYLEDILD